MKHPLAFISLFLILLSSSVFADVFLPRLISDGLVLQRDANNTLWGWANNGETVNIKLDGKPLGSANTEAGTWRFSLAPQKAGGPHTLEFQGENVVTLKNVYFGDVWIASGQSNMENPLHRLRFKFPDEIPQANNPEIRMFRVPKQYEFRKPKKDFPGGSWLAVTPETAGNMSAVAWFFAKNIYKQYKVPIGIIDNSYGGSAAESWMSEEALAAYPHYLKIARSYQDNNYLQSLIDEDARASSNWYNFANGNDAGMNSAVKWFDRNLSTSDWSTINVPSYWQDEGLGPMNGIVWFRKEIILPQSFSSMPGMLELGAIVDADTAWINGIKVGETGYKYPPRRYEFNPGTLRPGKNVITVRVTNSADKGGFVPDKPYVLRVGETNFNLAGDWQYKIGMKANPLPPAKFQQWKQPLGFYNAMLAPIFNTTIKGVLWYQGETNADRHEEYKTLFPAMIRNWREQFNQGDFPFIFVQLPRFMEASSEPGEAEWADMRAAQSVALNEPNTAMTVVIDTGEWNDIHPLDKKTVGERLALTTRKLVYGESNLVASGPTYQSMKVKGEKVQLFFDNMGSGLTVKDSPKDDSPKGFAIAGEDGKFYWANTKLKKKYLEVWSDKVAVPKKIRYAWANNPVEANFFNKEGLPAAPFEVEVVEEE